MGHAERFDHVLDSRRAVKGVNERALAPCHGQVVVELFVKRNSAVGIGRTACLTNRAILPLQPDHSLPSS
jgi:hypothetical protein